MSDFLPPIIEQMISSAKDKNVPEHIRFNYIQTLSKIRDACDHTIKWYNQKK